MKPTLFVEYFYLQKLTKFYPKPLPQWSKLLLPAVRFKGHRFQSPSGHELLTLSDCHSVSGTSLMLVRKLRKRCVMTTMPIKGYITMSPVSPLFQLMFQYLII